MTVNPDDLRMVHYTSFQHAVDVVRELWPWLNKAEIEWIASILVESYRRR